MTKLEKLIEELCPDGVEYRYIEEIASLSSGGDVPKYNYSKEKTEEFSIPIYSNGIGDNALYGFTNTCKIDKPCVTISARGTIGYCALRKEPFFPIVRLICVVPYEVVNADYLYYYLQTIEFKVPSTGIPQLTVPMVKNYRIPLPPLEVQREIVRILDNFTELTAELAAELTAELTARKKQYEYYRDELLRFGVDSECRNLGELVTIERGTRLVRSELDENSGVPVYQNSMTPLGYYSKSNRKANTTFVIGAGAAGQIGFSFKDFWAADDCYTFSENIKINSRYLYYILMKKQPQIMAQVRSSSVPRLPREVLEKLKISLPSLEIQERIVKVLDNFDAICNDLNIGLPAEINLRKKQYEYYRDKLLTFKEVKS